MLSSDLPRNQSPGTRPPSEPPLQKTAELPRRHGFGGPEGKPTGPPRLILCAESSVWAVAMQRAYPNIRKYWKRYSGWSAAWEAFQARPGSFLVVEFRPENLPEILDAFRWMERWSPGGRMALVADRRWADLEWMFRQAGLVHFTTSPRQIGPLVRMALRHLRRSHRPPTSLSERIWRRLPWPRAVSR
jgi:hypothetical protein